jgi:O-antigen ligase
VGLGSSIASLPSAFKPFRQVVGYSPSWWLQPVHNIFLLMLVEIGTLGLLIMLIVILRFIFYLSKKGSGDFLIFFWAFAISGLNDHYWLTLQQTTLILVIITGLILSKLLNYSQ